MYIENLFLKIINGINILNLRVKQPNIDLIRSY